MVIIADGGSSMPQMPHKKPGRPTKFSLKIAEKIYFMAGMGMTDKQLCWILGIHEDTLNKWKKSAYFKRKLDKAKVKADKEIENSLFMRAKGMRITEKIVSQVTDGKKTDSSGNRVEPSVLRENKTMIEKEIPPDVQACMRWLTNRNPDKWREKQISIVQDNRSVNYIQVNTPEELLNKVIENYGEVTARRLINAISSVLEIDFDENGSLREGSS